MIQLEFTHDDIVALQYWRFYYPDPRVQIKMEALFLKSQGFPHFEIARLTGISKESVHNYLQQYQQGGLERLTRFNYHREGSALMQHKDSIEAQLRDTPPATIKEAASIIESLTGIKRSPTQIRKFLKDIGMECRKVGVIPAKADPDVQEEFKKRVRATS